MSALSDLQDASKANTQAIVDLTARVAAIPASAATEAELAAVTAELVAAKAAADAIAKAA